MSEYILDNGDIIDIDFIGLDIFSGTYNINLDGFITNLPEINNYYARGKTLREIREELLKLYSEYIYEPEINLSIKSYRAIKIYISGEVNAPGFYNLSEEKTRNNALTEPPTLFKAIQNAKE